MFLMFQEMNFREGHGGGGGGVGGSVLEENTQLASYKAQRLSMLLCQSQDLALFSRVTASQLEMRIWHCSINAWFPVQYSFSIARSCTHGIKMSIAFF